MLKENFKRGRPERILLTQFLSVFGVNSLEGERTDRKVNYVCATAVEVKRNFFAAFSTFFWRVLILGTKFRAKESYTYDVVKNAEFHFLDTRIGNI